MKSLAYAGVVGALTCPFLIDTAIAAVGNTVEVNGDSKHTLASYTLKSGTVCVSIKKKNGEPGQVKVWTITNGTSSGTKGALFKNMACVGVKPALTELRVGFVEGGGPIIVTVTKEDLDSVQEMLDPRPDKHPK